MQRWILDIEDKVAPQLPGDVRSAVLRDKTVNKRAKSSLYPLTYLTGPLRLDRRIVGRRADPQPRIP
jgi:hypothetical protein